MAEQQFCAACGHPLRFHDVPIVKAAGYRYHSICYVQREAPSVKAPVMVN